MSQNKVTAPGRQPGKGDRLINWITKAPLRSSEKSVLLALASHVGKSVSVWPGQKRIAELAGIKSKAQVSRILGRLELLGYIKISKLNKKRRDGYRNPNKYKLNVGFFHKVPDAHKACGKEPQLLNEHAPDAHKACEGINTKESNKNLKVEPKTGANGVCGKETPNKKKKEEEDYSSISSKENSAPPDSYQLTSQDIPSLNACVWFDLFGVDAKGKILEPPEYWTNLPDCIDQQIEVSRLCSKYSPNTAKSWKATTAFWHLAGRLFFPKAPKFATGHNLTNCDMKSLQALLDEWGPRFCFVIGHTFSNWEWLNGSKRKYPYISYLLAEADSFEAAWMEAFWKVEHEDADKITALAKRLLQGCQKFTLKESPPSSDGEDVLIYPKELDGPAEDFGLVEPPSW